MAWYERTERLIGAQGVEKLQKARVAVFGIGGVGGHTVEALARSGIGTLDLIDHDTVSESNLNRQIFATRQTIGEVKVEAAKERIKQINPQAQVNLYPVFYLPDTAQQFSFADYDYVVDAVDTITAKLQIIMQAKEAGTPVISAMGAGNKKNPAMFEVADIYATSVCPLARVMRHELKKRGIKSLKVVYSKEQPAGLHLQTGEERPVPGSIAFVPAVAGLIIAGEVVNDLLEK